MIELENVAIINADRYFYAYKNYIDTEEIAILKKYKIKRINKIKPMEDEELEF